MRNVHFCKRKLGKPEVPRVLLPGVGLCDEWPLIQYPDQDIPGAFGYPLEPGMVFCVEVLAGAVGGDFSIKLEDQVLVTEDGYENLTRYPFDAALIGELQ